MILVSSLFLPFRSFFSLGARRAGRDLDPSCELLRFAKLSIAAAAAVAGERFRRRWDAAVAAPALLRLLLLLVPTTFPLEQQLLPVDDAVVEAGARVDGGEGEGREGAEAIIGRSISVVFAEEGRRGSDGTYAESSTTKLASFCMIGLFHPPAISATR